MTASALSQEAAGAPTGTSSRRAREDGHDPVAVDLPSEDELGQLVGIRRHGRPGGRRPRRSRRRRALARRLHCAARQRTRPVELSASSRLRSPAPDELVADWWTNTGYEESGDEDVFEHDVSPARAAEARRSRSGRGLEGASEPWPSRPGRTCRRDTSSAATTAARRRLGAPPRPRATRSRGSLKSSTEGSILLLCVDDADLSSSGWERRATQTYLRQCEYVADRVMEAVRSQEMNTAIEAEIFHARSIKFGASRPTASRLRLITRISPQGVPAVTPRLAARHLSFVECSSQLRDAVTILVHPRSRRGSCRGLPASGPPLLHLPQAAARCGDRLRNGCNEPRTAMPSRVVYGRERAEPAASRLQIRPRGCWLPRS